jgi:predicted SpoU family rRNA methylase
VKPGAVYDAEYKAALAAQSLSEVSNLAFKVHQFRTIGGSPCLSNSTCR